MDFKEKYGEWGVILGATEGVGSATAEELAKRGLNVVLVGRREEKLHVLGDTLSEKYHIQNRVIRADFSEHDGADIVIDGTKDLNVGFMSYVACLHHFGKIQDTSWEDHERMLNVNIYTFLKLFRHYMAIFNEQGRGGVLNYSSLTGITSSPYNAEYGAGKAYIKKLTEGVAYECRNDNIDVMVATLGQTLTPSYLSNLPEGPEGEQIRKFALGLDETMEEVFNNFGKVHSLYVGDHVKAQIEHWNHDLTDDEKAAYMGAFYETE